MAEEKKIVYDVDGYDIVTTALRELINQYPGLSEGEEIAFSVLGAEHGRAMFPASGAVIESEKEDITGHVTQVCLYPFHIVYRTHALSEERKATVKEWLDTLGKWLERQTVSISGEKHVIDSYPPLTDNRRFLSISRQTPGHLDSINDNQSENWVIQLSARYRNEFDR